MLSVIFVVLASLLLLLTFITLSRSEVWWVRGMDFPRLQIGLFALVVLLLEFLLLDFNQPITWLTTAATFACICYQAWWIIPYTPFYPVEVQQSTRADSDNSIAILAANVLTKNRNAPALLELVHAHKPDILVTLESDKWWQQQLDKSLTDYSYTIKKPLDNLYGMHVYSKLALEDVAIQFLVEDEVPSIHVAVVLRSGRKVRVHFLHPAPPSPTENDESTERDAELLVVAKKVEKSDDPIIVAGDLNDVAWSATTRLFRKISGLLDPRVGRGMFNSFHADYQFVRWPLDHLFHSSHFLLVDIQRLPAFGSDHFPMLIKLVFRPENQAVQKGIEPDGDDKQWANEKIAAQSTQSVHSPKI